MWFPFDFNFSQQALGHCVSTHVLTLYLLDQLLDILPVGTLGMLFELSANYKINFQSRFYFILVAFNFLIYYLFASFMYKVSVIDGWDLKNL